MALCVGSQSLLKRAIFSMPVQVEYQFSNQKGCGRDVVNELKGHRKEMLVYSNRLLFRFILARLVLVFRVGIILCFLSFLFLMSIRK